MSPRPYLGDMARNSIVSLFSAKPSLLGMDSPKTWVELVRAGEYKGYHDGPMSISLADLQAMVRNFEDPKVSNQVPITVGHIATGEPPAVGWIRELKVVGSVLMGLAEFLPAFAKKIRSGAYRYVSIEASPDFQHPNSGASIGATLHGLAVVNQPFIRGLAPIALSATPKIRGGVYLSQKVFSQMASTPDLDSITKALANATPDQLAKIGDILSPPSSDSKSAPAADDKSKDAPPAKDGSAPPVKADAQPPASSPGDAQGALDNLMGALAALAGVPAFESVDQAIAWLTDYMEADAEEDAADPADAEGGTPGAMSQKLSVKRNAKVLALSQEIQSLKSKVMDFEAKEVASIVEVAISGGQIHAGQKEWALSYAKSDRKGFDSFLASTASKPALRLGGRPIVNVTSAATEQPKTPRTPQEIAIRKAAGLKD